MASVVWEEEVGGGKWQRAEEFIIVGMGRWGFVNSLAVNSLQEIVCRCEST
jgi:hypothetical protein